MYELESYAVGQSKYGKIHDEPAPKYRTEFQRDRDRIIHSTAFRRLEYKTQVFLNHEGDSFRTRLTHSLEVAQIGRSVAMALKLNMDLVEAICLAHDLGHTPFGHVGQDELNSCLIKAGKEGFEHNLQSLRIVDKLEIRYADFDGLNLTFETREGILKHCSLKNAKELGEIGKRFLNRTSPSLEAQLANVADEIAYNYHDIDDGLRARLITLEQLSEFPLIKEQLNSLLKKYPNLSGRRLHKELIRHLIGLTIADLIESTLSRLKEYQITTVDEARKSPPIVQFSEQMVVIQKELKKFLMQNMYKHYSIMQVRFKASQIIRSLFEAYISDSRLLPENYQAQIKQEGLYRVVTDYISGMTDRYAFKQYSLLFLPPNVV